MPENFKDIDKFDELFTGNPVDIEKNLNELLPVAYERDDKSVYVQILSQIALAQAMQQKFAEAHQTLNNAEKLLQPEYTLAKIRVVLERGRVYHQSGDEKKALSFFIESYELACMHQDFDFHTINAAHMVAIVIPMVNEKIKWNKKALMCAEKSKDKRCQAWLGVLYNNLAQNYIEAAQYADALQAYEKCKLYAEERGDEIVMRGASWGKARALRSLNNLDEALKIQLDLLKQYDHLVKGNMLPLELIHAGRGLVYEELAEIYFAENKKDQTKTYALLAYNDLSKDRWMQKMYPERIGRMKQLYIDEK